jgi:N6-L-threonylcarbamoyladenine synthase
MKVLGVETSCDETAIAVLDASGDVGHGFEFKIRGHALLSQAKEHAQYGGVFPNVAKREHARNLVPVLMETLRQAELLSESGPALSQETIEDVRAILEREDELHEFLSEFFRDHTKPGIDCIAVTAGPGLEPALWVGINFARALSHVWGIPLVAVNHMEGHILVAMMHHGTLAHFEFPLVSLLVSGGHTELILSREWMQYEMLGSTRDDAAGEAFDKVARLLGLEYPGGPEISKYARLARGERLASAYVLPRPMLHSDDYDFSFAGLKTAVRNLAKAHEPASEEFKKQIAREFENAVTDVLVKKTMRAIDEYGARTLLVGGGVSANEHLRKTLTETLKDAGNPATLLLSPPELATDNAVMIALAGYFRALKKQYIPLDQLVANGNLQLAEKH